MTNDHTSVIVTTVPPCDIDHAHGAAFADASIPAANGSWANVCRRCFNLFECSLGLGRGQRFIERDVEVPSASFMREAVK